jgi:hypothetical protein
MSTPKSQPSSPLAIPASLAKGLGPGRTQKLQRLIARTSLPAEAILDLGLDLVDISSRKLGVEHRDAVTFAAARWRSVSKADRSAAARHAIQARWAKHRQQQKSSE